MKENEELTKKHDQEILYYTRLTFWCAMIGLIIGALCTWAICYTYYEGGVK